MPATISNSSQMQLLAGQQASLPSERFNTRATHIQCCPTNLRYFAAVANGFLRIG
jgi:hypothetical protein